MRASRQTGRRAREAYDDAVIAMYHDSATVRRVKALNAERRGSPSKQSGPCLAERRFAFPCVALPCVDCRGPLRLGFWPTWTLAYLDAGRYGTGSRDAPASWRGKPLARHEHSGYEPTPFRKPLCEFNFATTRCSFRWPTVGRRPCQCPACGRSSRTPSQPPASHERAPQASDRSDGACLSASYPRSDPSL
jgi:hypothetical protein